MLAFISCQSQVAQKLTFELKYRTYLQEKPTTISGSHVRHSRNGWLKGLWFESQHKSKKYRTNLLGGKVEKRRDVVASAGRRIA